MPPPHPSAAKPRAKGALVQPSCSKNPTSGQTRQVSSPVLAVFSIVLALMCAAILHRNFFLSGFDLTGGDLGDGRFLAAIAEHWTRWLHGLESWASPNFLYPEPGVLGYSDAELLFGPAHVAFRAMGMDTLLAFQGSVIVADVLGGVALFWFLFRGCGCGLRASTFGTLLFSLSNTLYLCTTHSQIHAAAYAPVLLLLVAESHRALQEQRQSRAVVLAAAAGAWLAALFLTTFYIAWFVVFSGGIAVGFAAAMQPSATQRWLRSAWRPALAGAATFMIGMVPFVSLYLPVLRSKGSRTYDGVLLPDLSDVWNVGPFNAVWGGVLDVGQRPAEHEFQTGFPLLTLLLFSSATVFALITYWKRRTQTEPAVCWIAATGVAVAATWILMCRFAGIDLWRHVFFHVPGASAVRVPWRVNVVLMIGVAIVIALAFQRILQWLDAHPSSTRTSAAAVVLAAVAGFALIEQWNHDSRHRVSRREEAAMLGVIAPPPASCREFFVNPWPERQRPPYASQIDAMLLAQRFNLPTVNGYSGWYPAGWQFDTPGDPLPAAQRWQAQHHLSNGFCELDLSTRTWLTLPGLPKARP